MEFGQDLIDQKLAQSRPGKIGIMDFNIPTAIAVKIEGYNVYRGIFIESVGVSGYELTNKMNFMVDVTSHDNKKIVKIQSDVLFINTSKESVRIELEDEYMTIDPQKALSLPIS